jgi:hypothetical protein
MTKGRRSVLLEIGCRTGSHLFYRLVSATMLIRPKMLDGIAALPFVKRTRISCHAAPDRTACAPFSKERHIKFANATKFNRKSGEAEGSAVPLHL